MEIRHHGHLPSTQWVMHAILDSIVDEYELHVNQVMDEADSLDSMLLMARGTEQSELLGRMSAAAKRVGALSGGAKVNGLGSPLEIRHLGDHQQINLPPTKSLVTKREIVNALIRDNPFIGKHTRVYMKNVHDNILRMRNKLALTRELISNLNAVHSARVSVALSVKANETSIIVKRFGVIGAVFLPLNLIAGIFGMNVRVPGMIDEPGTPKGFEYFISLMVVMILISSFLLLVFGRLRWF